MEGKCESGLEWKMICRVVFSLIVEYNVPRRRRGCRLLVFCQKGVLKIIPPECNYELNKLCDSLAQFACALFHDLYVSSVIKRTNEKKA